MQQRQQRKHKQQNHPGDHRLDHLEVHQILTRGQIQGQVQTLVMTETDMINIIMNHNTMKVSFVIQGVYKIKHFACERDLSQVGFILKIHPPLNNGRFYI